MNNKKYKKILIIGAELNPVPPVSGGAVEQLINYLIEENEISRFANLTIVSPYNSKAEKESRFYSNTEFIYINNNFLFRMLAKVKELFVRIIFNKSIGNDYIRKINKTINYYEYDLVIIENRPSYGPLIRSVYQGNLFLHLHNDTINLTTQNAHSIIDSFDKIIVISKFLKKQIETVQHTNIDIVYNGVDLNLFSNVKPYKSGIKKLLYVGRINKDKGIIELLKAYKDIDDNNSRLDIIGSFDYYSKKDKKFVKEFNELIKSKNINYIGSIPHNQLPLYFDNTYIGIIPTIVNEALSVTAIEMLSAGIPVIFSNVGGLPEVVNEKCGLNVDTNNVINNLRTSICYILENTKLRNNLSSNTKLCVSRFSKEKYVNNLINIIR